MRGDAHSVVRRRSSCAYCFCSKSQGKRKAREGGRRAACFAAMKARSSSGVGKSKSKATVPPSSVKTKMITLREMRSCAEKATGSSVVLGGEEIMFGVRVRKG